MSAVTAIVRKSFNKIFEGLSKEMECPIERVQLGIYYAGGKQFYEAYRSMKKEKDIDINDYFGLVMDFSGGSAMIENTVAKAGATYARELNANVDSIRIIMEYKKDAMPNAVLMQDFKKVRNINIQEEFLM